MFVAHVSNLSILPSLSHVSPVSAVLVHPLRHPLSVRNLAVLSRPKSAGYAPLRTCIEKFGYLAKSDADTGYEPKKFDKMTSVDNYTMLVDDPDLDEISNFSKNTRENTGLFGVPTLFESSVSHVSHDDFDLQIESKESMHRDTDRMTEREREKREEREERGGFVISVAYSMSKKNRRNKNRSYSLRTLRNFYSDGRDLREHLEELNKLLLVKDQFIENKTPLSTTWRSKIQSEEIQNTHDEILNLKDDNYSKPINGQIKHNEREHICAADWG